MSSQEVSSFQSTSSRERPTRSTRSLILNSSNSTGNNPVNSSWDAINIISGIKWFFIWWLFWKISEFLAEFIVSPVSKFIDSYFEVSVFRVVLFYEFVFLGKYWESEFIFLFGSIRPSVFRDEVDEFSFSFTKWSSHECLSILECVHIQYSKGCNSSSNCYCCEYLESSHIQ